LGYSKIKRADRGGKMQDIRLIVARAAKIGGVASRGQLLAKYLIQEIENRDKAALVAALEIMGDLFQVIADESTALLLSVPEPATEKDGSSELEDRGTREK
jgi:hypothetical protein